MAGRLVPATNPKPETDVKQLERMVAIKNGRGEIKGYIKMFWSDELGRFVTIPE